MKTLILETSEDWYTPNLLTLNRMKILILKTSRDWHTPNLMTQDLNEDSHFGFPSRLAYTQPPDIPDRMKILISQSGITSEFLVFPTE